MSGERDTLTRRPCPDGSPTDGGRWSRLATVASLSSLRRPTPTRHPAGRGYGQVSGQLSTAGVISGNQPADGAMDEFSHGLTGDAIHSRPFWWV